MRQSDYRKTVQNKRKANFMKQHKTMLNVYAHDLMGWEPDDRGIRCPECRPTTSHAINPDCQLCSGAGETAINVARGYILGEED
jgi:hypothetical protein